MSDWDVVAEKPAPSSDWSVANTTPVDKAEQKKLNDKPPVSFLDKLIKPRIDTERPSANIPHPPVMDELKSLGSGAAEGAVYSVPLAGQLIGGIDLGRAAATGVGNLVSKSQTPQPDTLASQIVGSLGLEHNPTTAQGEVMKFLGGLAPVAKVAKMATTAGSNLDIPAVVNRVRAAARFEPPKVVNENTKAAEAIAKNLQNLHKSGGEAPDVVIKMIKEARAKGQPLSFADVGGEENRRRAGVVYRAGGPARETVKKILADRDAAAQQRLDKSLNIYLGSGSVRQTINDLATARSAAGRPVFEEAMRGEGIPPLEKQYANSFKSSAEKVAQHSDDVNKLLDKVNELKTRLATNKDVEVGMQTAHELKQAEGELTVKEIELKQANAEKESVLEHMRTAQQNRIGAPPNAVWSPVIQRLTQNPIVKNGLNKGMEIERNLADAEGRTFDPKEYAVIKNPKGEFEIAKVPNMRVLAVAKEGLDNLLSAKELRDPVTRRLTKEGLSIQKLRDALVTELDLINSKYKEARDVWAGESAKVNALTFGEDAFSMHPDEISERLAKMSDSERQFARMALAEKMREKLLRTKINGDEAKALINNEWTRKQIRPFFRNEKEFNEFVKDVSAERTMFEAGVDIARNSLTADRAAADMADKLQAGVQGARGLMDLANGGIRNALHTAITVWQRAKGWHDPKLNEEIAKLLFPDDKGLAQIEQALKKVK